MEPVFVISQTGKKLMPTKKYGWVNHVLKDKKAKIVNRHPFTIQLQYKTKEYTQPLELTIDSGYNYVGVSLKSENR